MEHRLNTDRKTRLQPRGMAMNHSSDLTRFVTQLNRRSFLGRSTTALGSLALASLLDKSLLAHAADSSRDYWPGLVQPLHFAPKAKRVIHLCMAGGPSHLETLDYKPTLAELNGEPMPESFTKGQPIAQLQGQ